ncbi:hydroxyisourate hydrolase [Aspergillus lucknowensis]|uniref:hydroxyisourate hydrolase n=1 Tax=Aspergillus lucknowensis TaxID=176173 RepID=A0ABR4LMK8_9EURO
MDTEARNQPPSGDNLGKIADRLSLFQHHLPSSSTAPSTSSSPSTAKTSFKSKPPTMSRDPITCHVLNTLTGTPAANLPVTLTLLLPPTSGPETSSPNVSFTATTNADGRVASWTPSAPTSTPTSVPAILAALPTPDAKTHWALRFEVGAWFESQGIESFWPEVEVKFTVKGRGKEGQEGWRHYHVPVLLGPWNYSTYRGS